MIGGKQEEGREGQQTLKKERLDHDTGRRWLDGMGEMNEMKWGGGGIRGESRQEKNRDEDGGMAQV